MKKLIFAMILLFVLCFSLQGAELLSAKAGDTVTFGRYGSPESSPIEWQVLSKGSYLLLISKYALANMPYHAPGGDTTWEKCSLREWLNQDFYEAAFSPEEKKHIIRSVLDNKSSEYWGTPGGRNTLDRVYLLSTDEIKRFFPERDSRSCYPFSTREKGEKVSWWLRTPGDAAHTAASIDETYFDHAGYAVHDATCAVRPVIKVRPY